MWILILVGFIFGLAAGCFVGIFYQGNKNLEHHEAILEDKREQMRQQIQTERYQFNQQMKKEQHQFNQYMTNKEAEFQAEKKAAYDKFSLQKKKAIQDINDRIQAAKQSVAIAQQAEKQALKELNITRETEAVIQRKINGYGDQYLIPTLQLIDELAEQHSVHHAGEKLKASRATMRNMIKKGTATDTQNAVSLVLLDFFNTKAEELIGKVKHENYGKLKQELADVYALAEYHAKQSHFAASITQEYYQIRQDELKWASVLHTLRAEEREQQRALREQAKEEERARKEYEKAIKETAKEEAMLQAAMEKARIAMEKASQEQKAKYEQQLAELNIKLKEAEEKNQRALSMAQQTRAGHVYLISNIGSFGDNMMKIGMTRRLEPLDRVRELGDASVPFLFDVHAIIYSEDAPALEKQLHREFNHVRVNKVNHRKEFFRVSPLELKTKLAELGIQAQFTLAAEAAEYRETLRIEAMDKGEQDKLLDTLLAHEIEEE